MFWASSCPSSGAYQMQQQQPLVYHRNVVIAVLMVMVDPVWTNYNQQDCYHHVLMVNQRLLLLQLISS
jgi:hypothetical protein